MTSFNRDVTALFNKFAGSEIAVKEEEKIYTSRRTGEKTPYFTYSFANENDPLLTGMNDVAKQHGLSLRIWLPNTMGTCDMRMDRVNVHVQKDTDGKWRIGKTFDLG